MVDRLQEGRSEALLTHARVGVRLSDITNERLIDIFSIYEQSVMGWTLPNLDDASSRSIPDFLPELHFNIGNSGKCGFRFGSALNSESILLVTAAEHGEDGDSIVTFSFDSNLLDLSDGKRAQAQRLSNRFNREVNRYLLGNNIGVLLPTEVSAPVETENSVVQLGDALLDTAYTNDRIYRGPDAIDLGEFNEWVEALMTWTERHPQGHEAGGVITINFPYGLVEASDLIEGADHTFQIPRIEFMDYQKSKANIFSSAIGAVAHSHPSQNRFSPPDLAHILLSNDEPAAGISAILITAGSKYIAFRGEKTPTMSLEEVDIEMNRRMADYEAKIDSLLATESSPFEKATGAILETAAIFYQMCRDWDLQVFKCNRDESVLRRFTQEQMDAEEKEWQGLAGVNPKLA